MKLRTIAGCPVVGSGYDALRYRHTQRMLPRTGCTAAESCTGPRHWYTSGDLWIGVAAWAIGLFACVQIVAESVR